MFVLGTAGHIDHGKSALVQALTGMDPDRLREEKERGMTIDLGFAWFKLPGGREVAIVDVPGHERFVKNMLAGVGGIDLALLVVAANEGVMPQTREHLAIIDLLGIKRGVVVITKKDLVNEEWLSLVRMDVEELVATTTLAEAPIVAVSAVTRDGLKELASTIDNLLNATEPRKDIGKPRLPIDRVFTIAGAGTVVTGTLIDGSLTIGQEVEIVPPRLKSRIRGLQSHKAQVNTAAPGSRVAVNLVGIATSQLKRGDVLTKSGWLMPTALLSVQIRILPYLKRPLAHNTSVSFHTGAAEAMAKVRLLEKEKLEPGDASWAQLVLDSPVALVAGDRYIIRSPMETLGGGKIIEPHARRLRRFRLQLIQNLKVKEEGSVDEIILDLIEAGQPVEQANIVEQVGVTVNEALRVIDSLIKQGKVVGIGQSEHLLFTASGWERLGKEAVNILKEYHQKFPARSGMPKVELSSRLRLGKYSADILPKLIEKKILNESGLAVSLPSHRIQLTQAQQAKIDAFLRSLAQNPYSPPADLIPEPDLLNSLIEQRKVIRVSESVVFSASVYNEMVAKVTAYINAHGKVTLAEVRDLFNTSRKYAQAFLEYLDEKKITRRIGDERVLFKAPD